MDYIALIWFLRALASGTIFHTISDEELGLIKICREMGPETPSWDGVLGVCCDNTVEVAFPTVPRNR